MLARKQGADIIKRKTKKYFTLFAIIIFFVLIVLGVQRNKTFVGPDSDQLDRIIFIDVIDYIGVEKITIDDQKEIENILKLLKTAKRAKGKQSISDFPDKDKFTTIIFGFESGGNSFRSIYEEDNVLYIDQPYDYVYKLEHDKKALLYKIMNSKSKEDISLNLKQIHNLP